MRRSTSANWSRYAALAALGVVAAWGVDVVEFLLPATLVFMALKALAAVGLTLIMGYSGQAVLGHAAFFGIGAYASLILTANHDWPAPASMLVGVVVAGVVGGLLGRLVFTLSGHFLAMATLAFGLIFLNVVQWANSVTGGNNGGVVPRIGFGDWRLGADELLGIDGDRVYFLAVWALVIVVVFLANGLIESRNGRALIALRSSQIAAESSAVDTVRARTGIFIVGASIAALAGSLYAHFIGFVSPDAFSLVVSIELLVLVTLGGLRSVWGAPLGAFALMLIVEGTKELVERSVDGPSAPYEIMAFGLAIVIVLLGSPNGIAGFGSSLWSRSPAPQSVPGRVSQ